jgi:cobaltochelatase CobN
MHLLRVESRSIDGTAEAVDLEQTPADVVALSFSDTDLAVLATAWEAGKETLPSLRLANLTALRHPYSIDLYAGKVLSKARFVLVRLLGGMDYWRYGVDELAHLARSSGFHLAIVPGDHREDLRLDTASTLQPQELRAIASCFAAGGTENIGACLHLIARHIRPRIAMPDPSWPDLPNPPAQARLGADSAGIAPWPNGDTAAPAVQPFGSFAPAERSGKASARLALIVFYRAWMLAADTDPVVALAQEMSLRGFRVSAVYVTSLKDATVAAPLGALLESERPDVILNLTAFSARSDSGESPLDQADAPVLQLALSAASRQQWLESTRGLGPADLAMNVVLPELDGRIIAGAISFKGQIRHHAALEFTRLAHQPEPANIAYAADLALGWAQLARTPRSERRLACVLSDYPAKAGRTGYAVGLDTPRSVVAICDRLAQEGFSITLPLLEESALINALSRGQASAVLTIAAYERLLITLPIAIVEQVRAAWGDPAKDDAVKDGSFCFRVVRAGNLLIAVQPDRGHAAARKTDYHDPLLPPRHAYLAFYLWLRAAERVHAIVHCGTHGTLEWLPGKATALSEACTPRAVLGPVPLIYPFIVNNPGEAAQAKRRTAAVTIGHLTPPLAAAGTNGATAALERLFDEYAEAQSLDPRRAARLAECILARARQADLAAESGVAPHEDPTAALVKLDAWLCDIKDMRIGDGLHVFGQFPGATDQSLDPRLIASCVGAEMNGLLAALDGRFVPPGPAGSPARGRTDVLPTGRNLYSIDPRSVPTRTAWEIGQRTAEALLIRHAQDHGDWPRRIVLDVWGSATMRTGGDDLAQAFALLGVRPRWDAGSNRLSGFDVLPLAVLNRPRVDVTLRISGLFRDVFPSQIALFDAAVREVARLDEAPDDNPLAASVRSGGSARRLFGTSPGAYGVGLAPRLAASDWSDRNELAAEYLRASSYAYDASSEGLPAADEFRERVARADAFVHVQDMPGQDVLDADAMVEHEGGFAAAAASVGNHPVLYHADTTDPDRSKIRTVREEVSRILRARATNPRWLAGQMRHGFRGAAEIAQTVDNFLAYAALTDVTSDYQFDMLFDATIGDDRVRTFLAAANPAAASAIAERFEEAERRGFWTTRRNSASIIITSLRMGT